MHLLLRTLLFMVRARRRSRLALTDVSSLSMRALPTDIDVALHINNGQYFGLFDIGRFDLMVRTGFWDAMRRRRWSPVVQSEMITFRRSVTLWTAFGIETRLLGFDERAVWFEQRVVVDGEVYVRAYIATRLRSADGPVSNEEIRRELVGLGHDPAALGEVPEWLQQWRGDAALPGARKPAPHLW